MVRYGTHAFAWRNRRGSDWVRPAPEGCGGSRRGCGATVGAVRGDPWRTTPQVWCTSGRCWRTPATRIPGRDRGCTRSLGSAPPALPVHEGIGAGSPPSRRGQPAGGRYAVRRTSGTPQRLPGERGGRGCAGGGGAVWAPRHPLFPSTRESAPVLHPAAAVGPFFGCSPFPASSGRGGQGRDGVTGLKTPARAWKAENGVERPCKQ